MTDITTVKINTAMLASIATILAIIGSVFVFWNIRERQLWFLTERYQELITLVNQIDDRTADIREIHKGLVNAQADLAVRTTRLEGAIEQMAKHNSNGLPLAMPVQ